MKIRPVNNLIRSLLTIFLLGAFVQAGLTQKVIIKEIRDTSPFTKDKYVFPLIVIAGNKTAEDKINSQMQDEILGVGKEGIKQSIFEHVWKELNSENDMGWNFHEFSYKIYSNTNRYLCLSITYVGGKHEQTQVVKYLFDIATGNKIELKQLLNSEGNSWLAGTMSAERNKKIRKELAELKDRMQQHQTTKDSLMKEDDEKAIQLFKACLERKPADIDIEDFDFYIKDAKLFIEGGDCASSWGQERLVGGEYKFSKYIGELQQYLSAYGKKLLLGQH